MRAFLNYVFLLVLIASITSCETGKKNTNIYYPVDSLVNSQILLLTSSKAVLTKKAEIDGVEEIKTLTPKDSTAWGHELDIFSELHVINNSVTWGRYTIDQNGKDANSNLSVKSFTGKDTLPVVYLKIFYLTSPSKLRRVEALYREENSLLKGSRLLILEFQEIHNKTVLTSYSIEGSQKMFLGDSVKFSIKGTITIP